MFTDLEIAQAAKMAPVTEIAKELGIDDDSLELYGKYKAKVALDSFGNKHGKLILVTAINPTPAGEGKSTTTIGLGDALHRLGKKTVISAIILITMFVISSMHLLPLMACTMLAAGAMLVFKCCKLQKVTKYVEWELLIILGCTMVISTAITKLGIADAIANGVLNVCGHNPYIIMIVMCLLASIVSEFISDVGASGVFFPIVYKEAIVMGCNPLPFVISLMISVTISFASPIGSSTHMLIYGPGGFKFTDFMKIGLIMHIILLISCIFIVNIVYPIS